MSDLIKLLQEIYGKSLTVHLWNLRTAHITQQGVEFLLELGDASRGALLEGVEGLLHINFSHGRGCTADIGKVCPVNYGEKSVGILGCLRRSSLTIGLDKKL